MAAIARVYNTGGGLGRRQGDPGLAVVDGLPAPRRENFDFGRNQPTSRSKGSTSRMRTFAPFEVEVRDPVTAKKTSVTVIGVLPDVDLRT